MRVLHHFCRCTNRSRPVEGAVGISKRRSRSHLSTHARVFCLQQQGARASQHGRPREEVLRELPGRRDQSPASLHRLSRYRAVSRVLLGGRRNRQPPEMARLPAGRRRSLLPLGSRSGGRMDEQGRAVAPRCHRAVWLWKLGTKFLHFTDVLRNACRGSKRTQYSTFT